MRITGLVFAIGVLGASPTLAATDEDPSQVSEIAGAFAGVAESCGVETQGYASRVEELLKHMAESSDEADRLIGAFDEKKKATVAEEESERTIDCMDARRRFEELPINQPGWTVETGWASEML